MPAMTMLILAGCAAGTAIGNVGRYGEEWMGWDGLCDQVLQPGVGFLLLGFGLLLLLGSYHHIH